MYFRQSRDSVIKLGDEIPLNISNTVQWTFPVHRASTVYSFKNSVYIHLCSFFSVDSFWYRRQIEYWLLLTRKAMNPESMHCYCSGFCRLIQLVKRSQFKCCINSVVTFSFKTTTILSTWPLSCSFFSSFCDYLFFILSSLQIFPTLNFNSFFGSRNISVIVEIFQLGFHVFVCVFCPEISSFFCKIYNLWISVRRPI